MKASNANKQSFPYTLNPLEIPTMVIVDVADGGIDYQCPDSCWTEHHAGWCKAYRTNKKAPVPQSVGHCMFENPISYGCIVLGDTSPENRRAAMERHVAGLLDGWDRDLTPERKAAVHKATVDAKLAGIDTGASPFLDCLAI